MIAGTSSGSGPSRPDPTLLPEGAKVQEVEALRDRGIEKVRLISQTQFATAVRDAVARELLELLDGLELTEEQREGLEERALARLTGDRPPPALAPANSDATPVAKAPDFDFAAMEKRLLDEIGRLVAQNWQDEIKTAQDSQTSQIRRLEGRIDSLMRALDQVERMMDRMPETGPAPSPADGGSSSLAPAGGALGGIKNELLEQLFEANLALRELEAGEDLSNGNGSDAEPR